MHTIAYTFQQINSGLEITGYDQNSLKCKDDLDLPIKMAITTCTSESVSANVQEALHLGNSDSENFLQHYHEIFMGLYEAWQLTRICVDFDYIAFFYTTPESEKFSSIMLTINGTSISNLGLSFEVPHSDHRPPTKYTISMNQPFLGSCVFTTVTAFLPNQRKSFQYRSDQPCKFTVVEYADL